MNGIRKHTGNFTETTIDDEIVLMKLDTGEFFSMTGTAEAIWRLIDGSRDREALIAALASEFDAGETEIAADVDEFLARLRAADLLVAA